MGTHPNAILMAVLTPDDLSRKTMREILSFNGVSEGDFDKDIKINDIDYHTLIMEESYNNGWQISAKEGDLLFFNLVTYGYGERIEWNKLDNQKTHLEEWAKEMCKKFHCSYEIFITANYW